MHSWDDLRVFLAVARHKTFQDASEATRSDPTTIARRIERLEADAEMHAADPRPARTHFDRHGQELAGSRVANGDGE